MPGIWLVRDVPASLCGTVAVCVQCGSIAGCRSGCGSSSTSVVKIPLPAASRTQNQPAVQKQLKSTERLESSSDAVSLSGGGIFYVLGYGSQSHRLGRGLDQQIF
ncbi:hypothetical protein FA95DRAFT_708843 [Auriscalpium vulgare]|uniref:Uncharacterized protein n=1 Tax=Auriscalpium vulgare TaxID=40419 RepID=A0ACB8RCR1_9AGAM|nr:hypothetical protein FA95DRAFT_708843 [Auriscalpium vulgare]